MKVLCLFLLCALPSVAFSLSCVPSSFNRPRTQVIEEDFCGEYSRPDVYTARVVGATCNCFPASGDANLQCQDYMFATGTSVVNVEVVNRILEPVCDTYRYRVSQCSGLTTSLAGSGNFTVENVTTNLPPVMNRTDRDCLYSCPFNNRSSSGDSQWRVTRQPCVYMVEVTRVFKGNYTRGETLVVPGPDELSYGRILRLQEEYVVGIGGLCNPINEWSTVDSYSRSELNLLSELASGCPPSSGPLSSGAIAGVVLGGLVLLIVLAVIAVCVCVLVYGYRHPTSKIGLFMIEHRPKAKSLNEKSSYNVESGKTTIDEKE